jgi:single-stranded DNA-binding protein
MYTHTRFTVMGVLGVDPELSQTGGGTDRVRLSVSNDKGRESKWIKLTAFGKAAQNAAAYGRKGAKVFVEGHLEPRLVKLEGGVSERVVDLFVALTSPQGEPGEAGRISRERPSDAAPEPSGASQMAFRPHLGQCPQEPHAAHQTKSAP